jgi:hypothetical protein
MYPHSALHDTRHVRRLVQVVQIYDYLRLHVTAASTRTGDTYPIGVYLMTFSEIGRTPAVYRRSDVLCRAHDDGANDQEQYRVSVMQSVDDVVVVTSSTLRQLRHG